MPFAIELNLSHESGKGILELWESLAKNSINSEMLGLGAKPHITLAVLENLHPIEIKNELIALAHETKTILVLLSSVGIFPTSEGILFIAPVLTHDLKEIHKQVHKILQNKGYANNEYYLPGKWVPHCTIAMGLNAEKRKEAIEICNKANVFGQVEMDEMSVIEFRPVREIYSMALGKKQVKRVVNII